MKKLSVIFLLLCFLSISYAQDQKPQESKISVQWLSKNFGGYNLPLPLKVELSGNFDNKNKLRIKVDAFTYEFPVESATMTVWIEYPRGSNEIVCELITDTNTVLSTETISVPLREIRDTDQRLSAIVSNKGIFYNARYANFLLKEQELPDNWFDLSTLDEIVIVDYQRLNTSQLSAIRQYVEFGGVLILLENFTNSEKVLHQLNINVDKFTQNNDLETLGNRNYVLLRSLKSYGSGLIIKYKISDNLNISDELELIRKNILKTNLPWSYSFLRNIPDSINLNETQYFDTVADQKLSKTVQLIAFAIFITLMIIIIGLRYLKKLSPTEKMIYIGLFCIVLTLIILYMKRFNSFDTSSVKVIFTNTVNGNVSNFNTEVKMLKFNHAGSFEIPLKSNSVKIVSADFTKFNENVEVQFRPQAFTIVTKKQTTIFIAIINSDNTNKDLSVVMNDEKVIVSNLGKKRLEKLIHIKHFNGTKPVDIDRFSNLSLVEAQTPYRDVFSEIFSYKEYKLKMHAKVSRNFVNRGREFVTCFTDANGNDLQIIVSPIINQK